IAQKTESAGPGDLAPEQVGVDIGGKGLAADGRALEIDLDLEACAVMRLEFRPARAAFDAYGLQHADVAPLGLKRDDPRLVERIDEADGAAVENGHFLGIDLDQHIVDAEREKRRHEVLHRGDVDSLRVSEQGAEVGSADFRDQRPDLSRLAFKIGADEGDSGVGIGGMERYRYRLAAVNSDARQGYRTLERRLIAAQLDPHEPAPIQLATLQAREKWRSKFYLPAKQLPPRCSRLLMNGVEDSCTKFIRQITLSYFMLRGNAI